MSIGTVTAHLLNGRQTMSKNILGNIVIHDYWLVEGITGVRPQLVFHTAMTAPLVPQVGQRHEEDPLLQVQDSTASFADGASDAVIVEIVWGHTQTGNHIPAFSPQGVLVENSTTLQTVTTSKDADGNLIQTFHSIPDPNNEGTILAPHTDTVQIQVPFHTRRFTRVESFEPSRLDAQFAGTVNDRVFLQWAPRCWLCAGINSSTIDGIQGAFRVTYNFILKRDTWDATVIAINPATGKPYPNSKVDVEIGTFQVYEAKNFNAFNLRMPRGRITNTVIGIVFQ